MKTYRLYTGDGGHSFVEEKELNDQWLPDVKVAVKTLHYKISPPRSSYSLHNAPAINYVITVVGTIEFETRAFVETFGRGSLDPVLRGLRLVMLPPQIPGAPNHIVEDKHVKQQVGETHRVKGRHLGRRRRRRTKKTDDPGGRETQTRHRRIPMLRQIIHARCPHRGGQQEKSRGDADRDTVFLF